MNGRFYDFPFAPLASSIALTVLMSCQMDDTKQWNNPADPEGVNYHAPRVRVESDSLFLDSSHVELRVVATSPNAKIAKVQWSVDRQIAAPIPFKSSDSVMDIHVPGLRESRHELFVRVIDATGLMSPFVVVNFCIWNEPPKLAKVRDTVLSTRRKLAMKLAATDHDGKVAEYRFDTAGGRWESSATSPTLTISSTTERTRTIVWEARDDLGKSVLDTFVVTFMEKPVLTSVRDTALSASKPLSVILMARDVDPSGKIVKYLWSTSGSGWTDSSSEPKLTVPRSTGGTTMVRWAARNDQGKLSPEDTFNVSFVPAPVISSFQMDSLLADWTGTTGTVNMNWSGSIPGFAAEPVTWTLRFGSGGSLAQVYQGVATNWSEGGIDSGDMCEYELVAENRFGDRVKSTGRTNVAYLFPKPSYGIPWNSSVAYGYFTDKRDGQGYFTVKIGGQTWMAQNLNYSGAGATVGACPRENSSGSIVISGGVVVASVDSCPKYGRLYAWPEVMQGASSSTASPSGVQGICPDGWHVPSDTEWQSMEVAIGMPPSVAASTKNRGGTEGGKLKSTVGWYNAGNGMDAYGFRALPAGTYSMSQFSAIGRGCRFWTATKDVQSNAWARGINYANDSLYRQTSQQILTEKASLRCVRN